MSLKNWPYWLKGWIVGLITFVLLDVVLLNISMRFNKPLWIITPNKVLIYSLIFALIGWIYGKFKSKKRK